mmetsp:Transcript_8821/g.13534  ORF Transcript_8821/g.13534 Transcript_8821/m.13534 type:complete len:276 (-) Transcript_8821:462-1289(-)|eukprot:CAMPEP_0195309992 /NCGR_PEP_ID=MMETSP0707-20130614/39019_1 /TAXON_ID=33640 /ORGANISM="Asterionellopsis glacialis, Strain CCMP134" /LENGTH=275 /DNA_ID=CAMNT_0040374299 /DNA_START=65 /DNA_END=892 /DNA_ORIENTATION=+
MVKGLIYKIVVLSYFSKCVFSFGTGAQNERAKSRREFLSKTISSMVGVSVSPIVAHASETVGKDPECNDKNCLGVWDGLLADCPHSGSLLKGGAGCASSQDDTPGVFAEPWDYSESNSLDWEDQARLLVPAIQLVSSRRGDKADVLFQKDRYLRILFTDGKTGVKSIGEFYFTPDDTTVQFRVGTLDADSSILSKSLSNQERCELIRKELRYLKIPVLRNRKRTLLFVESDLDTFGPGSAALGPPAEMTTGELEGRQDVDPKLKIDLLQNFPTAK